MESSEFEGEISPYPELCYWEFLSNGVLVLSWSTIQKQWDIVDNKLIINGSYSNYYTILKLTKKNLDLGYEGDDVKATHGEDAMVIYHLVKVNY